ncbi:hypothetical protein J1N35_000913 [Gossypium stocksii]|uniref:Uncharacterized protein n=1 Tax=Gossypium stocksii TaxID=47602 RepID=A0A9D3WI33_9ROSI|nr:hypothetical protein J1N35_000913 [Gossypium stocksii]
MFASSLVSEHELVSVILAGLLVKYESVRVFAPATSISVDLFVETLIDYESRQLKLMSRVPMQAYVVQQQKSDGMVQSKNFESSNGYNKGYNQGNHQQSRGGF